MFTEQYGDCYHQDVVCNPDEYCDCAGDVHPNGRFTITRFEGDVDCSCRCDSIPCILPSIDDELELDYRRYYRNDEDDYSVVCRYSICGYGGC